MGRPEIAILVSSFERPAHLRRVLASIAAQRGVDGALEVVVTDDGSRDGIEPIVSRFADGVPFPVRMTTHPHDGFQLARCRNEGVAASVAPYLLFLDGDCLIPPDHVAIHLTRRKPHVAMAGYCVSLDEATSAAITQRDIEQGTFRRHGSLRERLALVAMDWKSRFYNAIGHATKPKLFGGNIGIARADYERVNGYDQNFRGWGCEDDDLRLRLRRADVGVESILRWTRTYHLWHPRAASWAANYRQGDNFAYLNRPVRLSRCMHGLTKRNWRDLAVRAVGGQATLSAVGTLLPDWARRAADRAAGTAEVEILAAGIEGRFGDSDCRVLIVPPAATPLPRSVAEAHLIFADRDVPGGDSRRTFPLNRMDEVLRAELAGRAFENEEAEKPRLREAA